MDRIECRVGTEFLARSGETGVVGLSIALAPSLSGSERERFFFESEN